MIKHELSDLFRQNSIHKKFVINYDGGTITNSDLLMEEFSLEESICSEEELRFGSCEASVIRFPISNVFTSLKGKVLDVSVVLDHNEDKPLKIGKYKVASDVPTADRKRKDITAYDALYDVINADAAEWYNALLPNNDSTVTLKQFRDSFFGYFGIDQVEVSLINDSMIVTKTIQPTELSGSVVANAICELNGCFGHINRDGLMDYVFLKGFTESVYPSDDLYPADDLFPSEANWHKYTKSDYPSGGCDYQEYVVHEITGLEIRQAENSVGAFVGERDNPYVVSDNFLTYGKTTEEMTTIAHNMLNVINGIEYRPFTLNTFRGNPCVEVGDGIKIYTDNQIIESYVLNRTLTGIQALSDSFETRGREYRTAQVNSVEKSLIQLRGKTNTLERTIDETRSEITKQTAETKEYADGVAKDALDEANKNTDEKLKSYSTTSEMRSEISQSADAINLSVSEQIKDTKKYTDTSLEDYSTTTEMNGAISLSAQGITQEVSKTYTTKTETQNLSTRIDQTADMIAIGIDKNGNLVTDLTLDKNGMTFVGNYLVINTKNLQLDEDGAEFSGVVSADDFTAYNAMYMQYKYGSTYGSKIKVFDMVSAQSPALLTIGEHEGELKNLEIYPETDFTEKVSMLEGLDVYGDIVSYSTISTDAVSMGVKRIRPTADNASSNGSSDYRWTAIYATDGTINTSDRNKKTDIEEIGEKYEELYKKLKPVVYRFKDGVRLHTGFVSQDIEESLEEVGLTALEFAGFCKDHRRKITKVDGREVEELLYDDDGNPIYDYSIRPAEFISLNTHMIQKAYKIIEQQQSEIDELKQSVSFLMEKLGGMDNE